MKSRDGSYTTDLTKNGTWRVRFYCEQGKRRGTKVKTATERDALTRAIKKQEHLDYWFPPTEENVDPSEANKTGVATFEDLSRVWLEHGKLVREISVSCYMNYVGHLKNHILPVLGQKKLRALGLSDIEELAMVLKKTKPKACSYKSVRKNREDGEFYEDDEYLSGSYRREILVVACMALKFAFERKLIPSNPFESFSLPECPEQPYDYWRLEEEDKFLQWLEDGGVFYKRGAKPHTVARGNPVYYNRQFKMRPGKAEDLYDVVLFALRTGLRKGEIGGIRSRDINFASNTIMIRRVWSEKEGVYKSTTKGKRFRRIEMNEDAQRIIRKKMMLVSSDKEELFNVRSWPIKNFSKYCAYAGVREIHFHSLRHTCLTNLANGFGMDKPLPLPQVQKIAGHSEISTTMRYVHTNGIENTTSLQWSRSKRKGLTSNFAIAESSDTSASMPFLRIIEDKN